MGGIKTKSLSLFLTIFSIIATITISYSLTHVDYRKPWVTLRQIALSYSNPILIDQNNNNRIDTNFLDVSLQNVTDQGSSTTHTLNVGGLNSVGPVTISGLTTINNNLNVNGKVGITPSFGVSIDASGGRITNVSASVDANDVATKAYVDAQSGGGHPYIHWDECEYKSNCLVNGGNEYLSCDSGYVLVDHSCALITIDTPTESVGCLLSDTNTLHIYAGIDEEACGSIKCCKYY